MPSETNTKGSRLGGTNCTTGATETPASGLPPADTATTTTVVNTAAGTAHRGAKRASTSQTTTTGSASRGNANEACTGARQMGSRIPASIALAIGLGMRVIARASQGQSPVMISSTPQRMKAPTAAEKSPVMPFAATSRAAPG